MLPTPRAMLEWAALTPRTINADMEVSSPAFTAAYVDWFLTHNGPYKNEPCQSPSIHGDCLCRCASQQRHVDAGWRDHYRPNERSQKPWLQRSTARL